MAESSQKSKAPSHDQRPRRSQPSHLGGWPYDASVITRNRYTIENGGLYTDVTFQFEQPSPAEDETEGDRRGQKTVAIGAHKALLAASSPFFRAMFESGMKESRTNVVSIAHVQPDVFFQMLEFIYTDVLKATEETIIPLMELGHMYIIARLSIQCCQYLKNRLNIDNVCHVLATCVIQEEKKLELRCWQIIFWATESVMRTEGFLSLDLKTVTMFAKMKYTVAQESVIWNGCVKWARNQPRNHDWIHLSEEQVVARQLDGILGVIDFASIPRHDFEAVLRHSEDQNLRLMTSQGKSRHRPMRRRWRRRPLESYVDRFDNARTNPLKGSETSNKTSPDSISFMCSKDVLITGVEIYTARLPTSYDLQIEVHEGSKRFRKYTVTIKPTPHHNRTVLTAKVYFEEDRLWLAKARKEYTVTVTREGHLPDSIGVQGHLRCWATGVRFEFANSAIVPFSRSTVSGGQFARIYFHVLNDV